MDLGLKGRVALVTGASSGLGLAIARELAQEGAAVALVARRKEELERQAADISASTSGRAVAIVADLRERDAPPQESRPRPSAALGPVDILVANAGGPPSTIFATTQRGALRRRARAQPDGIDPPGSRLRPRHAGAALGQGDLSHLHGREAADARACSSRTPLAAASWASPRRSPPRSRGTTCSSTPSCPVTSTPLGPPSSRKCARSARAGASRRSCGSAPPASRSDELASRVSSPPWSRSSHPTRPPSSRGTAIQVDGGQIGSLV